MLKSELKKFNKIIICDTFSDFTNTNVDQGLLIFLRENSASNPTGFEELFLGEIIEKNASEIRMEVLNYLSRAANFKVTQYTLYEELQLTKSFNSWWLLEAISKLNFEEDHILNKIIKICALEKVFKCLKPKSEVWVNTENELYYNTIFALCKKYDLIVKGEFKVSRYKKRIFTFKKKMINISIIFAYIGYLILTTVRSQIFFSGNSISKHNGEGQVVIFDALAHLKKTKDTQVLELGYWGNLPLRINQVKRRISFFHLFFRSKETPSIKAANKVVNSLNKSFHQSRLIESHMDFLILIKGLKIFIKYLCKLLSSHRLKSSEDNYEDVITKNLTAFFLCQICSKNMLGALIYFFLIEKIVKTINQEKSILFICENQHWEQSLIHHCIHYNVGSLIATPHSSVRFWDLRYFFNDEGMSKNQIRPLADIYAVNSKMAKNELQKNNLVNSKIRLVEALRYEYLEKYGINKVNDKSENSKVFKKRLLVIGDYNPSESEKLLRIATQSINQLTDNCEIFFRPHPAYKLKSQYLIDKFNCIIDNQSLAESCNNYTHYFVSNNTTTILELSYLNRFCAVFWSRYGPNFSPIRGFQHACFVSNALELKDFLMRSDKTSLLKVNFEFDKEKKTVVIFAFRA